MPMKNYKVSFWYNTDERAESIVRADNQFHALGLACESSDKAKWCDWGKEFRITIQETK